MINYNLEPDLLGKLKYDEKGLIPAIVQDAQNGQVLMLAYMNEESLRKSLETGQTWFYSRSRERLWMKGETSGHFQKIRSILYDCDADTLLFKVDQMGVACHEGLRSCFRAPGEQTEGEAGVKIPLKPGVDSEGSLALGKVLGEVHQVILDRKAKRPEGSYTTYLFTKGQDKILKKVGEETAEVIIASKNNNQEELVYEICDLLYHTLVLLAHHDVGLEKLAEELSRRR